MLSHNSLGHWYQVVFSMVQHHKYSITEIENLIPYERDIYFSMLVQHLEEQKEQQQKNGM
jgi:hypothetical protein